MSTLFLFPMMPPVRPESEALSQEIGALQKHFGGQTIYINPNRHLPSALPLRIPRVLFGFHQLSQLRRVEKDVERVQIYNPDLFAYPVLQQLRKPVIYTLIGGAGERKPNVDFFNSLAAVAASDPQSVEKLRSWGVERAFLARPGIDVERFSITPLPLEQEMRLLLASAPWTREQFASKGIDALLKAVQKENDLQLTLLWRDLFVDEIHGRIEQLGVTDRVTVINEQVDVNELLSTHHAMINLATTPNIVKAYPHSLMEALAAGKPVLISCAIPMAVDVEQSGAGQVVEEVSAAAILSAVAALRGRYTEAEQAAIDAGRHNFSLDTMLDSYAEIYAAVAASS